MCVPGTFERPGNHWPKVSSFIGCFVFRYYWGRELRNLSEICSCVCVKLVNHTTINKSFMLLLNIFWKDGESILGNDATASDSRCPTFGSACSSPFCREGGENNQ